MQLMCDAVGVLGSRHGLLINPLARKCGVVRFDRFDKLPELHLKVGARIAGRELVLPLTPDGQTFRFHDQRLTPCSMALMGIDAASGVKVKLTALTPFRPRDAAFSTTPVLGLRVEAEKIGGAFRWEKKESDPQDVELFVQFSGPGIAVQPEGHDALALRFNSVRSATTPDAGKANPVTQDVPQQDRVLALRGMLRGAEFVQTVAFGTEPTTTLDLAWCTFSAPTLSVQGVMCPFKYTQTFAGLDAVCDWARSNPTALFDNAQNVDGIVGRNNCSKSVNNLLAYTLHSWLLDTWWCLRAKGEDWFSVWEGSCYYHSTVDVEYTQAPFYLAVWPELLKIELDFWPEFSKDGAKTAGERGHGTLFLSHDTGAHASAGGQEYHHEMEVEETANYLILSYAYWRRTGDDSMLRRHAAVLEKYLRFLSACDTTGCGVPSVGVANTIDDASPAIQFGRCQTYLAVKCLAAFEAGAEMLAELNRTTMVFECNAAAEKIRSLVHKKGWADDHFVTLLDKSAQGVVDPWSGQKLDLPEVPGWDAPHIYTVNGLVPFDMVGHDVGLDEEKLREDLQVATQRCLREYGCVHTDFHFERASMPESMQNLAGFARNPGWISMNMLRDMAAFYRGVDLRALADRYWEWQVVTNTQEPKMFFETFKGNNLCFYPRGIAIWGFFEALGGLQIDAVEGIDRASPAFPGTRVPRLYDADWANGECQMLE
ncbi:MAG: hypothetical protein A3K19_14225 [Lentisphaerae bacterium RIFOXYB12_FULL_65_16]|nr:MAG: hypothetical protein A3K18_16260 [Lentisphaerae bacterium RIFOXYA12_64_32]OGV89122.1 MAG: hypothetical protein A3K19_14225 [Lentisphaerae bacterium RIFOXYB12_FULL_65_16]